MSHQACNINLKEGTVKFVWCLIFWVFILLNTSNFTIHISTKVPSYLDFAWWLLHQHLQWGILFLLTSPQNFDMTKSSFKKFLLLTITFHRTAFILNLWREAAQLREAIGWIFFVIWDSPSMLLDIRRFQMRNCTEKNKIIKKVPA